MKKFSIFFVILVFVTVIWLMAVEEKPARGNVGGGDLPTTTDDKDEQQQIFIKEVGQNVKVVPLPEDPKALSFPAHLILKSGQELMVYKGGDILKLFGVDASGSVVFRGGIDMGPEGPVVGDYYLNYEVLKQKADLMQKA